MQAYEFIGVFCWFMGYFLMPNSGWDFTKRRKVRWLNICDYTSLDLARTPFGLEWTGVSFSLGGCPLWLQMLGQPPHFALYPWHAPSCLFVFMKQQPLRICGENDESGIREHSHWALGGHSATGRHGRHREVCCLIMFVYCSFVIGNHGMTPHSSESKLCTLSCRVYF